MTDPDASYRLNGATPEQLRERKINSLRQELAYYERNAEEKRKALAAMLNENTETPKEES
jgi:hypothetical protein